MKKSRLFMSTGALVLAASALFATKANKKFTLTDVGYNAAGTVKVTFPSNILTTQSKINGTTLPTAFATLATGTSTHVVFRTKLVTNSATHNVLYID
jgi:hypothetical protein